MENKIEEFAALLECETREELRRNLLNVTEGVLEHHSKVSVVPGKKYIKVDVSGSGKYMIEIETEKIFGIKGYGVINRKKQYGTLDSIHEWFWGGYVAVPRVNNGNPYLKCGINK